MNNKADVTISYQFISSWNNFFIYQQLQLLKQISFMKQIPLESLLPYLHVENRWEQRLPISLEKNRCVARIYNKGYGGRCENKYTDEETELCKSHHKEFIKNGKCRFGNVITK